MCFGLKWSHVVTQLLIVPLLWSMVSEFWSDLQQKLSSTLPHPGYEEVHPVRLFSFFINLIYQAYGILEYPAQSSICLLDKHQST